ncbi:hypothetical protein [Vibrio pectenicida]
MWYSLTHGKKTQLEASHEALNQGMQQALTEHVHASRCIDPLPDITPQYLIEKGWLSSSVWAKTPWQVALQWERVPQSDFVVLSMTYTATDEIEGVTLREAAADTVQQWRYHPATWSLSVQNMVSVTDTEWAMMDFDMESGCYASYD